MVVTPTKSRRFHPFSLDAINFLLADVRGALGPYVNVFLVTQQHWSQTEVGLVTTIGGLLGLAVQTPIGAAIDETGAKRGAIVLALAVLGIGAPIIFAWPSFAEVALSPGHAQARSIEWGTILRAHRVTTGVIRRRGQQSIVRIVMGVANSQVFGGVCRFVPRTRRGLDGSPSERQS